MYDTKKFFERVKKIIFLPKICFNLDVLAIKVVTLMTQRSETVSTLFLYFDLQKVLNSSYRFSH